jgi:nitrogen fixation protein NifQ
MVYDPARKCSTDLPGGEVFGWLPSPESSFDRHVLGRIVLHSAVEGCADRLSFGQRLGLNETDSASLLQFLHLDGFVENRSINDNSSDDEELLVRELLLQNQSEPGSIGAWLAGLVARSVLEPNHLWEDLGLAKRPDLSRLLERHFAGLAQKNTRNMRWKRFLYRSLCEAEGFSMCTSPTCDACSEFHICFGDESGESVMARNNRAAHELGTKSGQI